MKTEVKNLVEEIKQIREQYESEVGPGGRKVWPRAIKGRVGKLIEHLGSIKEAGEMTGISSDTLYAWRAQAKIKTSQFKQISVVNAKSVTVTDTDFPDRQILQQSGSVTVTVTTPRGFLIEGLPPDLAVEFLLKIGVR
jgi:hypothetical protein